MKSFRELRWGTGRSELAPAVPLETPLSVFIEPTNVCNFRCAMCPQGEPDYAELAGYYSRMPLELYRKIMADLREFSRPIKSLKLWHSGEPLLHPQLPEMIRVAREMEVTERTEVTTNGSMLNAERAAAIVDAGLTYLQVSVYSVDPGRNSEITGARFTPSEILENVRTVRRIRDERGVKTPHIYAKMIWDSEEGNARFAEAYAGVADEVGITQRNDWSGFEGRDFIQPKSAAPPAAIAEAHRFEKRVCPYPFYVMAIKANGDVSACCVDWMGGTKSGNAKTESLSDIWNGQASFQLQMTHLRGERSANPACGGCTSLFTTPDNLDALRADEYEARWNARNGGRV